MQLRTLVALALVLAACASSKEAQRDELAQRRAERQSKTTSERHALPSPAPQRKPPAKKPAPEVHTDPLDEPKAPPAPPQAGERPSLVENADDPTTSLVGYFAVDRAVVLDGDTIRLPGLRGSVRLLGIDTEETFKKPEEHEAYADGWEQYVQHARARSARPVKFATPVGEEAKRFLENFLRDATQLRVERDHDEEVKDVFGRYLGYLFAKKNGQWVNYNVECVRAGMSPYFQKYGRSRRFNADFLLAQKEAQHAHRGIWDPTKEHYPDYDERLEWWSARGDAVARFDELYGKQENVIYLNRAGSLKKLQELMELSGTVFGLITEIVPPKHPKMPTVVNLAIDHDHVFPVVFFTPAIIDELKLAQQLGEYVAVSGKITSYEAKPQIVVSKAKQVSQFLVPLPKRTWAPATVTKAVDEKKTGRGLTAPGDTDWWRED